MLNFHIDTGSSWTWLYTCDVSELMKQLEPNEAIRKARAERVCKSYMHNLDKSMSGSCTTQYKYIKYGTGSANGTICNERFSVLNGKFETIPSKLPFISSTTFMDVLFRK